MFERVVRSVALGVLGLALLFPLATPTRADGPPILFLPTPRGETWQVIQGYNCGTHDGWGRLSFDIVNSDGRTRGAPVYAAADGTIFYWGANSGTLILHHGDGYYTMYTHMQSHIAAPTGTWVARGTQVGTVGSVSPTPTIPHLHFTFFRGDGPYAYNRRPLPLAFAEGYDFPDEGTCNDHAGALLTATGEIVATDDVAPTITWDGAPAQTWTNADRIDWTVSDDTQVAGFSQSWDGEPSADAPQFADATAGFETLSTPGQHTLFVRAWDAAGNQTLESREFWFDPTPPSWPATAAAAAGPAQATTTDQLTLEWPAAVDDLSGVSGYQVYFGPDASGTSDWFVSEPAIGLDPLGSGTYFLRVRPQDNAGNFGSWTTVKTVDITPPIAQQ